MSTLKINRAQFGQSGTATNNFTLTAEAADGTLKLARGNTGATTQDILTVDASGNLGSIDNSGLERMVLRTAVATTSGTAVDFTGIPSWAKKITVMFFGVSGTTAGAVKVRALVGGVEVTSGYTGTYFFYGSGASAGTVTDAFCQYDLTNGATTLFGATTLVLFGANTWMCNGAVARHGGTAEFQQHAGSAALSGLPSGIRILCTSGTFDGGSVNILIEG